MSDKSKILDTLICEIKIFNSSKKLLKEETININLVLDKEGGDAIASDKFKNQQENIQ